ncbi:helix-turn-helix domain-containing protein [Mesorhizobium sp. LHD-90]|uniref:TetR/AcrR family transcriptional regulator n=1 Tax=Mesorhizobium sp. LHD-90 TaxID=3071414 RepID=UPI0027DF935B|nr:helix-turn-helix domain-containing protein [Mesorhizobium sp. LHD-90]MDQ6436459.1 helix-turn-helix domain-containing protein [Mesorhizobium sp. LHD-90]
MQEKNERRSNRERSESTRAVLIEAARRLFIEKGYAETATPDIVAAAGVTRGALYHHFEDKKALFSAVAEAEARAVAEEIDRVAPDDMPAREALVKGGEAYLDAMTLPGRTRLLLLDGPAVLGRAGMDEIDDRHAARSLRAGILFAVRSGDLPRDLPVDAATHLLSSAYDRAALAIEAGGDADAYRAALAMLIDGVAALAG